MEVHRDSMPDEETERRTAQENEDAASKRASANGSDDLEELNEDYDYYKPRPEIQEAREALKALEADIAKEADKAKEAERAESIAYFLIRNEGLIGPTDGQPYASICVLDPLITVERHSNNYHITARFHLETTILGYSTHERDGHEKFFQDIRLQYMNSSDGEDLITEPQSNPLSAFSVTRTSNTTLSGNAGASLSHVPSANVSLGISRSRECTVQYSVNSWSVSAHRVVAEPPVETHKRFSFRAKTRKVLARLDCRASDGHDSDDSVDSDESDDTSSESPVEMRQRTEFKTKIRKVLARLNCQAFHKQNSDDSDDPNESFSEGYQPQGPQQSEVPRYQWFWAATYQETGLLTPDIKHTVKRYIVVSRVVPVHAFPVKMVESAKTLFRVMEMKKEGKGALSPKALEVLIKKAKEASWEEMRKDWEKDSGQTSLERLLDFSFQVQIRVRKPYGRLHRGFLFTSSRNKAKVMDPIYTEKFRICQKFMFNPTSKYNSCPPEFPNGRDLEDLERVVLIPLSDTHDLRKVLAEIKTKYNGKWDELQSQDWRDLVKKETGIEQETKTEIERKEEMMTMRHKVINTEVQE